MGSQCRTRAAVLAAVVLLAGCGGSSRLSHEAFVERANAICRTYDDAVKRLRRPQTATEVAPYTERVLPLYRRAVGELAKLRPPARDESTLRALLQSYRVIERDLADLAAAGRSGQVARVRDLVRGAAADDRRSSRLARRLGLTVCAVS
jgi:hypothetical protein